MAGRSLGERLLDIREAVADLRDIVADIETEAFHALPHADRVAFRAIKNALGELGEAVKAISPEVRQRHADVDWKGFAGLRDLLAHQYFGIDSTRLLPIIRDEGPALLAAVEAELQRLSG